ncbi:MAG: amino acid aminotransferase [Waddliaceae bacterium]
MSFFESVENFPGDPIFGLEAAFAKDTRPKKVNLGVGAYRNAEGRPHVLSAVRKSERIVVDKHLPKEYPPILGSQEYIAASIKLVFGEHSPAIAAEVIAGAQTLGATGALRVGGEFLVNNRISGTIFFPDPTWLNHPPIFRNTNMKLGTYPYFDPLTHQLNFSEISASIKKMPARSTILFQGGCHNPTGKDPTLEQWKEISKLLKKQRVIPFFDFAYQGFGQGLDQDAEAIRLFVEEGHEMLVASSYSKNLGLYGERVGLLSIVCRDKETANSCSSQIQQVIRGSYSMPPLHGQRIVTTLLQDKVLRNEWEQELASMRERVGSMRQALVEKLMIKKKKIDYSFLKTQNGIFSYSMLNPDQVHRLKQEFAIYLPRNGRINVAGLNHHNLDYVVDALISVC